MIFKIFEQVLWEKSLYIAIAVLGFISSLISLFIDINTTISIKWLLGYVWLSLTIGWILVEIIYVIATIRNYPEETKVIHYIQEKQLIILKTTLSLSYQSLLSIYKNEKGYEELIAVGYVLNIQENNTLQVQILKFFGNEDGKSLMKIRNQLIFKATFLLSYLDDLSGEAS